MFKVILKALPIIYAVQIISHLIEYGLNQGLMVAMQKESTIIFFIAIGFILNALVSTWLITGTFLSFLLSHSSQSDSESAISTESLKTRWHDLFRESLKGIGEASLWIFVFIIPGLIRFLIYSLLPYVVFFDKSYQDNKAEILRRTREYARGRLALLFSLWFVFQAFIPVVVTLIASDYNLIDTPIKALFILAITSLAQVGFLSFLFFIFKQQQQKINVGVSYA